MYSNDGSHTALWTTQEWVDHGMPSNDGQELVVLEEGAFGNETSNTLARILFADGRTLKLTLDEAVPRWQQWPRSFEFDDLLACTKADLNDSGNRLTIGTNQGDEIEYRLSDGNIVTSNAFQNTVYAIKTDMIGIAVVIAALSGTGIMTWMYMSRHRRKRPKLSGI